MVLSVLTPPPYWQRKSMIFSQAATFDLAVILLGFILI